MKEYMKYDYSGGVTFVCVVTLSMVLLSTGVMAQQTRDNTTNQNAWLMYFGNHKLTDRFGVHAEIQWRRHDGLSENQQMLLRGGVDYYLKNNARFTAGYGFIKTYPYGEFGGPEAFPEHRAWQQFLTTQSLGKLKLAHRYRLEQRWIGNAATGEMSNGRYENRVRYMAKATLTLTEAWQHPMFAAVYDEIFVNFGKEVAFNIFDQNRLYGALGFTLSASLKLEVGYLYQLVQLRSLDLQGTPRNRIENNHTLQVGLFSTLAFTKKETQ